MSLIINLQGDASQRLSTTLGGQSVIIELWWNDLIGSWFISLKNTNDTPICTGRRLSAGNRVFEHVLIDFEGDLVPEPLTTPAQELGRNSWGITHKLVYYGSEE